MSQEDWLPEECFIEGVDDLVMIVRARWDEVMANRKFLQEGIDLVAGGTSEVDEIKGMITYLMRSKRQVEPKKKSDLTFLDLEK